MFPALQSFPLALQVLGPGRHPICRLRLPQQPWPSPRFTRKQQDPVQHQHHRFLRDGSHLLPLEQLLLRLLACSTVSQQAHVPSNNDHHPRQHADHPKVVNNGFVRDIVTHPSDRTRSRYQSEAPLMGKSELCLSVKSRNGSHRCRRPLLNMTAIRNSKLVRSRQRRNRSSWNNHQHQQSAQRALSVPSLYTSLRLRLRLHQHPSLRWNNRKWRKRKSPMSHLRGTP